MTDAGLNLWIFLGVNIVAIWGGLMNQAIKDFGGRMKEYEIIIKLVANRKPSLDELHDFFFCRIRDRDLKYTVKKLRKKKET